MTRRHCEHPGCTVVLLTMADNRLCRWHRQHVHAPDTALNVALEPFGIGFAGRCCGDPVCGYGARRPF
jgi:hypothetical protein